MSIPSELRTPRLLLRPWRPEDAEQLAPILVRDNDHLAPWIPAAVATPASGPQLAERLSAFAADFAAARSWRFALLDVASNELLGEIDLFPRNATGRVPLAEADRAEVGYWLRSDRTGNGFVTEAVQAVIDAATCVGRFSHIEIRCDVRNARSAAVPARIGFRRVDDETSGRESSVGGGELSIWMLPLGETPAPDV